jgi:Antibiotic biosynthesis monooxygenase
LSTPNIGRERARYHGGVIVRVLTARVQSSNAGPFHDLMRKQLPLLHAQDGLVYVKLARRIMGPTEEVVLFEEWRDATAMYGWTGPDIQRPRLLPGTEDLIEDLVITHYEALDIDPPPD